MKSPLRWHAPVAGMPGKHALTMKNTRHKTGSYLHGSLKEKKLWRSVHFVLLHILHWTKTLRFLEREGISGRLHLPTAYPRLRPAWGDLGGGTIPFRWSRVLP